MTKAKKGNIPKGANMKKNYTVRGFEISEFQDERKNNCSLQKSSSAEEDCIWLGCDEIGLKKFTPFGNPSWVDVDTKGSLDPGGISYIANNRMHLTREQVKDLLPLLSRFAKTGDLFNKAEMKKKFNQDFKKIKKSAIGCKINLTDDEIKDTIRWLTDDEKTSLSSKAKETGGRLHELLSELQTKEQKWHK